MKFTYNEPNTLFLYELANKDGGDRTYAAFLPAHYLKQFHPTYGDQADIDKMVADAKFKTWTELFASKNAPFENPDRPTMAAWYPTSRISEQIFTLKRNPYYVGVDTPATSCPTSTKCASPSSPTSQALNLAAIAGELDMQDRHINMTNYPVLKEDEDKENYHIITWPGFGGADAVVMFNQTYQKDPELGKLMQNKDFRIALSHAIDRDANPGIGLPGPGRAAQCRGRAVASVLSRR